MRITKISLGSLDQTHCHCSRPSHAHTHGRKIFMHFLKNARFIKLAKMTFHFNSRYAMKCNFSQSWISNFQNVLGEHAPNPPRRQQKIVLAILRKFWGVREISHLFLTLKLDRSAIQCTEIYSLCADPAIRISAQAVKCLKVLLSL